MLHPVFCKLTIGACMHAAHVDHGKSTLFDKLLAYCGHVPGEDRYMDSGVLEKERGITITSKYTSFQYGGHTMNAVDTPGHADFGGEVERCVRRTWLMLLCRCIRPASSGNAGLVALPA